MKQNIEWLIGSSNDSKLIDFTYSYNILQFKLRLFEYKGVCLVRVNTDRFVFDVFPPEEDGSYGICHFDIENLSEFLNTQHGFYIPEFSFVKIMEARRMNWTQAFGLKAIEYPYMLNLRGAHRLMSCLVKSIDDIDVELLEE